MSDEKKSMSAAQIVMIVIATIMGMGMATCGACAMCVGMGASGVAKQERAKEMAIQDRLKDCANSEPYEWAAILQALKANEAKVAAIWKGNCMKVTGIVDGIAADFENKPVVMISGGEKWSFQKCHCQPVNQQKAMALKKGQRITAWGIGGNEIVGSLFLERCDWN